MLAAVLRDLGGRADVLQRVRVRTAVREKERRAALEAARVAEIRTEQHKADELLRGASAQIDEALRHIETWNKDVVPLNDKDNAAGRAIGEQAELVDQIGYLFRQEATEG